MAVRPKQPAISEILAPPREVILRGRMWKLSPLTFDDYAMMTERILAGLTDPIEDIKPHLKDIPEGAAVALLKDLVAQRNEQRTITADKICQFMQTIPGLRYALYLMARKNHPNLTEDDADSMLPDNMESFAAVMETIAGLDGMPSGNSPHHAKRMPKKAKKRASRRGGRSVGSSRKSTTGRRPKSGTSPTPKP